MTPDLHTLTGAYAVGALNRSEEEAFERHLELCESCAQEVRELEATATRLGTAAARTPPAGLRSRVLAEVATTRQLSPYVDPFTSLRGRRQSWTSRALGAAAAVLLIAAIGLGAVATRADHRADRAEQSAARVQAVLAAPDARTATGRTSLGGTATVVLSERNDDAVVIGRGLPTAPTGKSWQLWFMEPSGAVSGGLLSPDGEGKLTSFVGDADLHDVRAVGLTIEPAGGSRRPTSKPVLLVDVA